jgi:hypothetical protein
MMKVLAKVDARKQIGVIGAGACGSEVRALAERVGREVAKRGAVMLCGGLGGVMEAAAYGAKQEGGITLGILPGAHREEANLWIDIARRALSLILVTDDSVFWDSIQNYILEKETSKN